MSKKVSIDSWKKRSKQATKPQIIKPLTSQPFNFTSSPIFSSSASPFSLEPLAKKKNSNDKNILSLFINSRFPNGFKKKIRKIENLIPKQVFFTKGSNKECKFDFQSSLLSKYL